MNRPIPLFVVLALASCGGIDGSEGVIETQTSALVTVTHRLLHDDPAGGCDTRDYSAEGDWYNGFCKTECAGVVTGLSSSFPQIGKCGQFEDNIAWGGSPALDPDPGPNYEEFTHLLACNNGGSPAVSQMNGYTIYPGDVNDIRSPNVGYDWAYGHVKGECDNGSAIVGVASDDYMYHYSCDLGLVESQGWAYGIWGARCSPLVSPPNTVAQATNCQVVDFTNTSANEAGGGTSWVGTDWDYGYHKGECGPGRYVKGIAHAVWGNNSARATKILCCSPQYITIPG